MTTPTTSKREALLALVKTKLTEFGNRTAAALEFASADSLFGSMQGDPIATIRFTESGIETLAVDPEVVRKVGNHNGEPYAKFALDEANDRAFLSYGDFAPLSGRGGTCIINLDGTTKPLVRMMSFT